jgi:hypothetical protein
MDSDFEIEVEEEEPIYLSFSPENGDSTRKEPSVGGQAAVASPALSVNSDSTSEHGITVTVLPHPNSPTKPSSAPISSALDGNLARALDLQGGSPAESQASLKDQDLDQESPQQEEEGLINYSATHGSRTCRCCEQSTG